MGEDETEHAAFKRQPSSRKQEVKKDTNYTGF